MVTERSASAIGALGRGSAWRFFLAALILSGFAGVKPRWRETLGPARTIHTRQVMLDADDPDRRRVGDLTYLGGVRLMSRDSAFGGFSDLVVRGDRFVLISDRGGVVRFRMGKDWRPRAVRFGDLEEGPGPGWSTLDRDSESLAFDPAGGNFWVGYERANQIWRYGSDLARATGHAAPPAMAEWSDNSGLESLTRLSDGSFLALSEWGSAAGPRLRDGIWFAGDPVDAPRRGFRFYYRPPSRYAATSLVELPDGDLLVLLRRLDPPLRFSTRIERIARSAIRKGAVVEGREVATLAAPLIHENFEGIAVSREGKDTILWIVSDDNLMLLQRSLLLKFRLEPNRAQQNGPRADASRRDAPGKE
ncbi:esterase-like activity of phytase family protein [Stakelama tenebrarum]|uniref:Esterase-like activity of phytase family protein n=1 Tax=Stakelama tenebrarum TaxID=2711215 RepID=A0A6G6Y9Q8_9SPHN|nr:esterase-like activity of phytase family protein [Sphingosinithalassobacter tenebrarum]QIG81665.1 esterase-like activity of phytase family protein [Sphingosinithalassobacter tenebrarum]